jgi:erythromycin esterase-like protein
MKNKVETEIIERVSAAAQKLSGADSDYDSLLAAVADKQFVLLGEASHGTHEFYRARAQITRRLIVEHKFNFVAVEADFPNAARVNRFVRGRGTDANADSALADFTGFPRWMWRNRDVLRFVEWLGEHNARQASDETKASFFGIDLYSLHASIEAVLAYLDRVDPEAAARARSRYNCFEHFADSQAYGYAASAGHIEPCEDSVVEQLIELQRRALELATRDGREAAEEFFIAEQNARLVRNAEEYYRSMFRGRVSSWNLRDRHMIETIEAIAHYGDFTNNPAKIVVWAHNSHLGDARATEMGAQGEWNVGQLARERFGAERTSLVGFTTCTGAVTAATDWGDEPEHKSVRPAIQGSYEELFHRVAKKIGAPNFLLTWQVGDALAALLREPRLERAIGVIYRPETERHSHYFEARLSEQFDHVIHFDVTRAVSPLEPPAQWSKRRADAGGEMPETFPTGM